MDSSGPKNARSGCGEAPSPGNARSRAVFEFGAWCFRKLGIWAPAKSFHRKWLRTEKDCDWPIKRCLSPGSPGQGKLGSSVWLWLSLATMKIVNFLIWALRGKC